MKYHGEHQREVSFPLGGLGSGCIGLTGWGGLANFELFGRPNKKSFNGFTHFAVRTEENGRTVDCRVLQGDLPGPYLGEAEGMGFGPDRHSLAGFPHFRRCVFDGQFPVATLTFRDEHSPLAFRLKAFNPFVPLDAECSSMPVALFELTASNPTDRDLTAVFGLTAGNPFAGKRVHRPGDGRYPGIVLGTEEGEDALCLACDAADAERHCYWLRSGWYDSADDYWQAFAGQKPFLDEPYPPADGYEDHATLTARVAVPAGRSAKVRFALAWYVPAYRNPVWPIRSDEDLKPAYRGQERDFAAMNEFRKYYAIKFSGAEEVAQEALQHYASLFRDTDAFRRALFGSTLPRPIVEAVSRNLAILKSSVFVRLADGFLYGFEGTGRTFGSCEGNCSHVYNYSYALAVLFPELERQFREAEFVDNLEPDGKMNFRVMLPRREHQYWNHRACCDGQFGAVLKLYRDYQLCGDLAWVRSLWPGVKAALAYAWSPANPDRWDPDRTGVLWGRQHETLDTELFGPNSWLTGFYVAALQCAAELAAELGDGEAAAEYRDLSARGKRYLNEVLFNGEYYAQKIDFRDKSLLAGYDDAEALCWLPERGEIKYQVSEGCGIDQVVAGYHTDLMGVESVFERGQLHSALQAIYRHNFVRAREVANPCRLFALNDERGVMIMSYPEGREKPTISCPYAQEMMNGFEYQFAAHLVCEGYVDEALAVVEALQARYDGAVRNPYSEIECGNDYVRSLASFSLLLAFSGQRVRADGSVTFAPRAEGDCSFFCCDGRRWGVYERRGGHERVRVLGKSPS